MTVTVVADARAQWAELDGGRPRLATIPGRRRDNRFGLDRGDRQGQDKCPGATAFSTSAAPAPGARLIVHHDHRHRSSSVDPGGRVKEVGRYGQPRPVILYFTSLLNAPRR